MKREHPRDAIVRLTAEVEALEERVAALEGGRDELEPHEHKDWRARAHNREAP